jgi:hypothetical protein
MKLVIGVGTSIGMCYVARENEESRFDVYPSEVSMMRMPAFN